MPVISATFPLALPFSRAMLAKLQKVKLTKIVKTGKGDLLIAGTVLVYSVIATIWCIMLF
jgi:hypothetical protein